MDDSIHEEDEEFRLVLGTPKSKSPYGASIGEQKEALVTVTDKKDSMYFIFIQNNLMPATTMQNSQNSSEECIHPSQPIPADTGWTQKHKQKIKSKIVIDKSALKICIFGVFCSYNLKFISVLGPIIRFSEIKYSIREPQVKGDMAIVKIPILRLGDTSKVSVVRVHTKDGSATSGDDYNPLSEGNSHI